MQPIQSKDLEEKKIDKTIGRSASFGTYFSFGFFLIVVALTVSMFFYNKSLKGDIEKLNGNILQSEEAIAKLKNDPMLNTYGLLLQNEKILTKLEYESQVTRFIDHLEDIEKKYKIKFNGFNYSSGKLTTSLMVKDSEDVLAYKAITKFIKEYRVGDSSLFHLDFVKSLQGHDTIKLSLSMNLKETK